MKISRVVWLGALVVSPLMAAVGDESGVFVQLNRDLAARPASFWHRQLDDMKALGVNRVVVQWSAEDRIAYFKADAAYYKETYDVLAGLLDGAGARGMTVYLGLYNDTRFWDEITAAPQVLRDYFLVRIALNERLQRALLAQFDDHPAWEGYYIPDEIDDLSWRDAGKRSVLRDYLAQLGERLRANDAKRRIAVSSFFRARTEPAGYAANLRAITGNSVDHVLIQDGIGAGDVPMAYVAVYYEALAAAWTERPGSDLWGTVEVFRSSSAAEFAAEPAPVERVQRQIAAARPHFSALVFFSYAAYMDRALGGAAARLYDGLSGGGGEPK